MFKKCISNTNKYKDYNFVITRHKNHKNPKGNGNDEVSLLQRKVQVAELKEQLRLVGSQSTYRPTYAEVTAHCPTRIRQVMDTSAPTCGAQDTELAKALAEMARQIAVLASRIQA
jgi:hypothetical protein